MHIDVDAARERGWGRGGKEGIGGAPAAVPEIGGRVFVGDEEEDYGGRGGADCGGGGRVVFGGVGGKGFEEGGAGRWCQWWVGTRMRRGKGRGGGGTSDRIVRSQGCRIGRPRLSACGLRRHFGRRLKDG